MSAWAGPGRAGPDQAALVGCFPRAPVITAALECGAVELPEVSPPLPSYQAPATLNTLGVELQLWLNQKSLVTSRCLSIKFTFSLRFPPSIFYDGSGVEEKSAGHLFDFNIFLFIRDNIHVESAGRIPPCAPDENILELKFHNSTHLLSMTATNLTAPGRPRQTKSLPVYFNERRTDCGPG